MLDIFCINVNESIELNNLETLVQYVSSEKAEKIKKHKIYITLIKVHWEN